MAKSDLGKVLEFSLTVGRADTDNIQLGRLEALWKEESVPDAYGPRDAFAALVATAGKIEGIITGLAKSPPEQVTRQATSLAKAITAIKADTHVYEHDERSALAATIKEQQENADKLLLEVETLKKAQDDYEALPLPVITTESDSIDVFVNTAIKPSSFKAKVTPNVALELRTRDNAVVPDGGFSQPSTRSLLIVAQGTSKTRYAERKVTANVRFKARTLVCPPGVTEFEWGADVTPAGLGVTHDGPTPPVITNLDACSSLGEQTLAIMLAAEGQYGAVKGSAKVRILQAERSIEWTLPAEFLVADTITPESLGVEVRLVQAGRTIGDAKPRVLRPAGGAFRAGGDTLDLTVTCAATKWEKEVTRSAKVRVIRHKTAITWHLASSIAKNSALAGAATIEPDSLRNKLMLNPASIPNRIGPLVLNATYAGDATYEPAASQTKVLVVEAARMVDGANEANAGRALPPLVGMAKDRLDEWNASRPDDAAAIGTIGKRLMRDVSAMDSAAVLAFIAAEQANNPDVKTVKHKVLHGPVNMVILSYKNGLEVRHKDNGGVRYDNKPTVSIEVRNDPSRDVSDIQDHIAFKVTMSGEPGPRGPDETLVGDGFDENDFKDGAMKATHLVLR